MHLEPLLSPSQKMIQRLILSREMQQSLHLLQLPLLELSSLIAQELEENPLLEVDEDSSTIDFSLPSQRRKQSSSEDLKTLLESRIPEEESLFSLLKKQAVETFSDQESYDLAELLIGSLDNRGFLETPLDELAKLGSCSEEKLFSILEKIQTFDPPGIGARNFKECLLLQLKRKGKEGSLSYRLFDQFFEEILHNQIPKISRSTHHNPREIQDLIRQELTNLCSHPASLYPRGHYQEREEGIFPDIIIHLSQGEVVVEVNGEGVPQLRINESYLTMFRKDNLSSETKTYLGEKILASKWLLRNLQEREKTLHRIGEVIARKQHPFLFENGHLLPLTMREIADDLEVHESTVARAVADKYLFCPRGLFSFRSFFTRAYLNKKGEKVSSKTIRDWIAEMIHKEETSSPLSDEALSSLLKEHGIECARRTVAKYRHELGIGNASKRKNH